MVQFLDLLKREFTFIQICCDALISVIIDLEADNPEAKLKTIIFIKIFKSLVFRHEFINLRMGTDLFCLFCSQDTFDMDIKFLILKRSEAS